MADGRVHVLANNQRDPVFRTFEPWMKPDRMPADLPDAERELRASIARGSDIFLLRQFWLRDVAHINSIGLGNPIKRTCTTCHNAQMTGMDLAPGWVDVGTANYPTWTEPPVFSEKAELPVFKITCDRTRAAAPVSRPHDLHDRSGTRADHRALQRRRLARDGPVPRPRRAGARTSRTDRPPRCASWWTSTIAAST